MFNMFCVFVKEQFWQSGVIVNDSAHLEKMPTCTHVRKYTTLLYVIGKFAKSNFL